MPSKQVFEAVRELIEKNSGDVPFQETTGMLETQKGLPDVWSTLEFSESANQRLSVGNPGLWREYGQFVALFLCKSGYDPVKSLAVAEVFANLALDYQCQIRDETGVVGALRIDNASPPNTEPYENGNWLVVSVSCVYTYDRVRTTGRASIDPQ